ncbi:MAG: hypothetical protein JNN15_09545 [Blastocatellia bacterium]|nr:hypothetical protein [Blastocatellia bacterium]
MNEKQFSEKLVDQKPKQANRLIFKQKKVLIVLTLLFAVALIGYAPRIFSHAEDIVTDIGAHSTFHYELTRILAVGTGFCKSDAETIAVANEATDVGSFTGENGYSVQIRHTSRVGNNSPYWHFARRGAEYLRVSNSLVTTPPTSAETCDYFAATNMQCPKDSNGQWIPELDGITNWSLYGANSLTPPNGRVPQFSTDGGATFSTVQGRTLTSLGLYLHSLTDSYSHEACMQVAKLRSHQNTPTECNANNWHIQLEYGNSSSEAGVQYTITAGTAAWRAMNNFRAINFPNISPVWTESQAVSFITAWAQMNNAQDRRNYAVSQYNSFSGCIR